MNNATNDFQREIGISNSSSYNGTHATNVGKSIRFRAARNVFTDDCWLVLEMHGGLKVYRGSPAAARSYVEADRGRADDYYLAESTGVAQRYLASPEAGVCREGTLTGDAYEAWVGGYDPATGAPKGRVRTDAAAARFVEVVVNGPKSWSAAAEAVTPMTRLRRSAKEATAYHEAGHAVMRLELGRRPIVATVKPDKRGGTLGHVTKRATKLDVDYFDPNDWRLRRWADTEIMTVLAGPEAERRYSGRRNNVGARSDDARAADVAWWSEESSERTQAYLKWLSLKVRAYISSEQVWKGVEAVATALLEKETLSGKEVREAWLSSHRLLASSEATLERLANRGRPRPVTYDYHGWVIKRDGNHFVVNSPEGTRATIEDKDVEQMSFGTLSEATDLVDRALASEHRR